ncbi:MAG: hypothetical protein NXI32_29050, partial [bacterium]|nr:hypothetical protein [bacterium]
EGASTPSSPTHEPPAANSPPTIPFGNRDVQRPDSHKVRSACRADRLVGFQAAKPLTITNPRGPITNHQSPVTSTPASSLRQSQLFIHEPPGRRYVRAQAQENSAGDARGV